MLVFKLERFLKIIKYFRCIKYEAMLGFISFVIYMNHMIYDSVTIDHIQTQYTIMQAGTPIIIPIGWRVVSVRISEYILLFLFSTLTVYARV